MSKIREWEITTRKNGEYGTFRFVADNKELAHDHAMTLKNDPFCNLGWVMVSDNINERVRELAVRFVGWTEKR